MGYDIFILLIILGGMLVGFTMGLVRQAINIAGLYFGLVFASYYHPTFTRWARETLGEADSLGRETMIFFLVFGIIWAFINVGAFFSFRQAPRFLPAAVDRLIGMALGIFTGVLMVVIITLLLDYATDVSWPQNDGLRVFIRESMEVSGLRRFFVGLVPTVASTIQPFMPRGLPAFFLGGGEL
ncbi:MAG: CvpA family protein [Ardenticatenales bacterium]|nr:CvpA family protein [Ardenticatenales bacterium]